jgi:acetyl-CoA C-acetyltransferase
MISSPLHLLDCCMISDGGGALVLTSLERARDLGPPVVILGGAGLRHTGSGHDLLDVAARQSGPLALWRAGVKHEDVDLCMVYDSYTITVLVTLEALGFCRPGEGGAFVSGGRIALGGALPVNTDGGGLSSNHPGMRGIFLVVEATRQLRGECGPRQVRDAEIAVCHGTGGMLGQRHSGVTLVLGRA